MTLKQIEALTEGATVHLQCPATNTRRVLEVFHKPIPALGKHSPFGFKVLHIEVPDSAGLPPRIVWPTPVESVIYQPTYLLRQPEWTVPGVAATDSELVATVIPNLTKVKL